MPGRFDALTQLDKKPVQTTTKPVEENVRKSASIQADKPIHQQNHISPSPQVDMSASKQNNLAASPQVDKSASGQTDTSLNEKAERYTTRLQPSLIKQIKRYAFEHEINDYDVVQNAIKGYLEKNT